MSITGFSLVVATEEVDCIVTVGGELDVYTARRLRQALEDARRAGPARVVVDLAAVTFIDSTAIGVLVRAYKLSADLGVSLIVRNQSPRVSQVIEISGLCGTFPMNPPPDIDHTT